MSAILHNKAAFPASLTQLATALTAPPASASSPSSAATASPASTAAVGSEFARQRVSLLGRVSSLQSELATRWTDSKRANVALMRDNAALIKQMQNIRADIKLSNSKASYSTHRAAADSTSKQPLLNSEQPDDTQLREDEVRKAIVAQRAHIIALREHIHSASNNQTAQPAAHEAAAATQTETTAGEATSEERGITPTAVL